MDYSFFTFIICFLRVRKLTRASFQLNLAMDGSQQSKLVEILRLLRTVPYMSKFIIHLFFDKFYVSYDKIYVICNKIKFIINITYVIRIYIFYFYNNRHNFITMDTTFTTKHKYFTKINTDSLDKQNIGNRTKRE